MPLFHHCIQTLRTLMACQKLAKQIFYNQKMKKILSMVAIAALLFTSCKKDENTVNSAEMAGKATISIDAVVGANDFALNTNFTANSKTWNFTQLRYWVSNVILINAAGAEYAVPNSFYLMEENTAAATNSNFTYPANKRENIQLTDIPAGDYTRIKFMVGVPEKYNNNLSLQAGELSQLNGMTNVSWMWATSYIFSSLKGTVNDGTVTKSIVVETGLNSNLKSVTLSLPQVLHISSARESAIFLSADVSRITDGVDIIATPTVGGTQATLMTAVANNYSSKVFTVKSVK
jgi:hypothetical protein